MKEQFLSEDDQSILKTIALNYIEEIQSNTGVLQDPFELYAETIKFKFYANNPEITDRFIEGYLAILKELDHMNIEKKNRISG